LGCKTERKRTMSSRGLYEPKESRIGQLERWLTIDERWWHRALVAGKNGEEKWFLSTTGVLFICEGVSDVSVGPLSGRPSGRQHQLDSNGERAWGGARTLVAPAPE
jgi:hypothetical protein